MSLHTQDNSYFISETELSHGLTKYEYSAFETSLGSVFLTAACSSMKNLKAKKLLTGMHQSQFHLEFIPNFKILCECLKIFLKERNLPSVYAMQQTDWHQCFEYFNRYFQPQINSSRASLRKNKQLFFSILNFLANNDVITKNWDPKTTDTGSPFFLIQKKNTYQYFTYEFSRYSTTVGHDFVIASCAAVRDLKMTARVKEKTWVDNYVMRLEYLLESLQIFLPTQKIPTADAMDISDWKLFIEWISYDINSDRFSEKYKRNISDKFKNKNRLTLNNLLSRLATAKVIPQRFEIDHPSGRTRARQGQSIFTQRGWQRKEKNDEQFSPFAFRVEGHNRRVPYDYSAFQPLARLFLLKTVQQLEIVYKSVGESHAKLNHRVFISFLCFLQTLKNNGFHIEFFATLDSDNYKNIDDLTWENLLYDWRKIQYYSVSLDEQKTKLSTKHSKVQCLNRLWAKLANAKLVPQVNIRGFKNAKASSESQSTPSLAQLSTKKQSPLKQPHQTNAINDLSRYFDESEKPEAIQFINALCENIPRDEIDSLTLETLTQKIRKLNADRLQALRRCAESDFIKWHEHWQVGQRALAATTLKKEEIVDLLDNQTRSTSERNRNASRLIYGESDHQLGNCLQLALGVYGGILTGINGRYHHIRRRYGGQQAFHAYLHPHRRATVALWVMLLTDTGANCEVVREMPFLCIQAIDDPTHMKVSFSLKARAGYKRIEDHLPIEPEDGQKLSAVQAVQIYQDMSVRLRGLANGDVKNMLLLDERHGEVIGVTEFSARDDFKYFIADHPELAELHARPSFIRPSYLLNLQHQDLQGRMEVAQAAADHASMSTTKTYTLRSHTKMMYAQKIREFQNYFQSVIISSIDGAAEKLGISREESQRLFSVAARSGLGIACLNSKAGIQPGTKPGEDCTRLDACPGCGMRFIVGTVENISDLILFHEYLKSKEEEALKCNPANWEQRWLPWLVLAEIALAKLSQGDTASAYLLAQTNADARRPTYKPLLMV